MISSREKIVNLFTHTYSNVGIMYTFNYPNCHNFNADLYDAEIYIHEIHY